MTPYLLASLVQATEGAALEANLAAVRGNVRLGADIAIAYSGQAVSKTASEAGRRLRPLGWDRRPPEGR